MGAKTMIVKKTMMPYMMTPFLRPKPSLIS